jgi:transcriptional regulator GlxA family with amidase domain
MYKASELLKNTKMLVAEVGASVGYDNQLHFSRAFRNIFGISPKNYRYNHRLSQNN